MESLDQGHPTDSFSRLPRGRLGIGVVGYGRVARRWHVPMYRRAGLNIAAICDLDPQALQAAANDWPDIPRYSTVAELLANPAVEVVDLATPPTDRLGLVAEVVGAGRHVLAQKPLALSAAELDEVICLARRQGVRIAVNQNGRFAPAWRRVTELLRNGTIGRLRAITHTYDTNLRWTYDPKRHATPQFLMFDYSNHWIDICGYWLEPDPICAIQAMEYDSVQHTDGGRQQSMWVSMESAAGVSVLIRGAAAGLSHDGHQFVVQGDAGTLRGSVDCVEGEHLELDDGAQRTRLPLRGEWFGDAFVESMVELLLAVEEHREPQHSFADNRRTVSLVAAACASARSGGARVFMDGLTTAEMQGAQR